MAFLAQLSPAYGKLPDDEELVLELRPTIAPLLSGNPGPSGELAEVLAPHLLVEIRSADGTVHNRLAIDLKTGFDLKITADHSGLEPTLSVPEQADISVFVLDNSIGADEILIQGLIPSLLSSFVPTIAGDLGVFELPEFSGLRLEPIEVAREGAFFSIYANVSAAEN